MTKEWSAPEIYLYANNLIKEFGPKSDCYTYSLILLYIILDDIKIISNNIIFFKTKNIVDNVSDNVQNLI